MQPAVRVCVPTSAMLGLFCRGCLSRAQSLPGRSFSCLPRRMSRWNSQEACSPPPPQENPRVLITGNANFLLSWAHNFLLTFIYSEKDGLFHSYPYTEPVKLPLFSTTFTVLPLFCTVVHRAVTIGVECLTEGHPLRERERVKLFPSRSYVYNLNKMQSVLRKDWYCGINGYSHMCCRFLCLFELFSMCTRPAVEPHFDSSQ